jgi:hypothetical protein
MHPKFIKGKHKTEVNVFCSGLYKIARQIVVKQGKLPCGIGVDGLQIVVEQSTTY